LTCFLQQHFDDVSITSQLTPSGKDINQQQQQQQQQRFISSTKRNRKRKNTSMLTSESMHYALSLLDDEQWTGRKSVVNIVVFLFKMLILILVGNAPRCTLTIDERNWLRKATRHLEQTWTDVFVLLYCCTIVV
jgi:exonuclease III